MRHDPITYRAVCKALDELFKEHGDKAGTCLKRYLRIRLETRQKEQRVAELESELRELKKVERVGRIREKN